MDDAISNDHFDAATIPTMTVNVTITHAINPTYQWQRKKLGDSAFTNIDGATSSAYTPGNPATGEESYNFQNLYTYRCVVNASDVCGTLLAAKLVDFEVAWGCGAKTEDGDWLNFMCHNLGADENLDPFTYVSYGDNVGNDIKGDLYQWGRVADGHEKRTSPNYPTNDITNEDGAVPDSALDANGQVLSTHPAYGKFIKNNTYNSRWTQAAGLSQWNKTPIDPPKEKTLSDPCPSGWVVPRRNTLYSIYRICNCSVIFSTIPAGDSWRWTGNGVSAGKHLYLPAAGMRQSENGTIIDVDSPHGYYTTSETPNLTQIGSLIFTRLNYNTAGFGHLADGYTVRCVQEK
jgi:hypothetical protein